MKIFLLAAAVVLAIGQDPPPAVQEGNRTLVHRSSLEMQFYMASLMGEVKVMVQAEIIPLLKTMISLHNTTTQNNSEPRHCNDFLDSRDSESGVENMFTSTNRPPHTTTQNSNPPRHCKDLLDSGDSRSGVRDVFPDPDRPHHPVEVYCEQEIDGGGWTVFQRRTDSTVRENFNRIWIHYKEGFGKKTGEFWLGLQHLHLLTNMIQQEARIDLHDYEGEHRWAKYGLFHVGSQDTNYRLTIDRYSGDAGDDMQYNNGREFTARGADHDSFPFYNCADGRRGGWWYAGCGLANLNGYQHEGDYLAYWPEGIVWHFWRDSWYSLRRTTMMVRPAF